jgi:hypothetical protein
VVFTDPGIAQGNHLPCGWQPTLLSDSLRLETGTVLRAARGASISPGTHSHERTTNWIDCPLNKALQTIEAELDRFFDQAFPGRKAA